MRCADDFSSSLINYELRLDSVLFLLATRVFLLFFLGRSIGVSVTSIATTFARGLLKQMVASRPKVMSAKGQRWRGKSSGRSMCRFINGKRLFRWCSMAVFPCGFGTNSTRNALQLKPAQSFVGVSSPL